MVYLLAKFAFDIAEKEPSKVCPVDSASRVKHSVKNRVKVKNTVKNTVNTTVKNRVKKQL